MPTKVDFDKRVLRWLRNRSVMIWASGVTISILFVSESLYAGLHFYHWLLSTPHGPFTQFVVIFTNLFFGLASSLGLIFSIWILGQVNPERFTTAQELLRHCIDLFEDANKCNCEVNLLILFPNPGQFDDYFNLPKRKHEFSELKQKITACFTNPNVRINLVCLDGTPTDSNTPLYKFLDKFYKSESKLVNPRRLTRLGGKSEYFDEVDIFIKAYLTDQDPKNLSLEYIHSDWLREMDKGEPIMVVGYARNEAFLGTISFKGDEFDFVGFDFKGDFTTIKTLYDSMKAKYTTSPTVSAQKNANPL